MRGKLKYTLANIRYRYNINQIATKDEQEYIRIQKGISGLRQVAILAYKHLKNLLKPYGYTPILGTVGL